MTRPAPPPRLFLLLARDVDCALILRRGPTHWTHLVKWDMRDDTFEYGEWIKGRIYAEKCDLSPDGKLLIYSVWHRKMFRSHATESYTALSRAPWLSALALWPAGTPTGGGGRFIGNRALELRLTERVEALPGFTGGGLTISHGNPVYQDQNVHIEGADWTGNDRQGRLVVAKEGKIFRQKFAGSDDLKELLDLNGLTPDPRPAPAWAAKSLCSL